MRISALEPRKAPRQNRSKAMLDLILEAATRVLQRESLVGFNTNRVAEVAGISVGSLYQYFPNKAALVTALIDRAQAAIAVALEQLVAELDGCSLEEAVLAMAAYAVRQQYGDPLLAAALDHEEKRLPIQARLLEAQQRIVGIVQTLLDRHTAQLSSGLPAAAAADCLTIAKAMVEADAGRSALPPAGLPDRIARAIYGYLTVAAPADRMARRAGDNAVPARTPRASGKAASSKTPRRRHAA